jgi:hypothetical protein
LADVGFWKDVVGTKCSECGRVVLRRTDVTNTLAGSLCDSCSAGADARHRGEMLARMHELGVTDLVSEVLDGAGRPHLYLLFPLAKNREAAKRLREAYLSGEIDYEGCRTALYELW